MTTKIWAHRGSSAYAPENTLEAFELAIKHGADGIELDVHLTSDGEIVVAHDERLERVSNGTGLIAEKPLAQLKELDFSKTHPEYSPVRMPALSEVFELIKPSNLTINIEIKANLDLGIELCKKLFYAEQNHKIGDRLIYSSFNHYSLMVIREINPAAKIGLLYSTCLVDPHIYAKHLSADAVHPYYPTIAAPGVVEGCKKAGIKIHAWTVDNKEAIKSLINNKIEAVITNVPDIAKKIRDEI